MTAGVEMSGRMLTGRLVAASDMAAGHAKTEMDPVHPHLEAFLASLRRARSYRANLLEMTAL